MDILRHDYTMVLLVHLDGQAASPTNVTEKLPRYARGSDRGGNRQEGWPDLRRFRPAPCREDTTILHRRTVKKITMMMMILRTPLEGIRLFVRLFSLGYQYWVCTSSVFVSKISTISSRMRVS